MENSKEFVRPIESPTFPKLMDENAVEPSHFSSSSRFDIKSSADVFFFSSPPSHIFQEHDVGNGEE